MSALRQSNLEACLADHPAPSLADLAHRAIALSKMLRDCADADWDHVDAEHFEAERAFKAKFREVTGLSPLIIGELCREGLIL